MIFSDFGAGFLRRCLRLFESCMMASMNLSLSGQLSLGGGLGGLLGSGLPSGSPESGSSPGSSGFPLLLPGLPSGS